jgi:hypothetical protein
MLLIEDDLGQIGLDMRFLGKNEERMFWGLLSSTKERWTQLSKNESVLTNLVY